MSILAVPFVVLSFTLLRILESKRYSIAPESESPAGIVAFLKSVFYLRLARSPESFQHTTRAVLRDGKHPARSQYLARRDPHGVRQER
jgi:hypothetical protein